MYHRLTLPDQIGQGKWDTIHSESVLADDETKQKTFCQLIRNMCKTFPCADCKKHFSDYLEKNPPEKYIGVKVRVDNKMENIGMALWAWIFHNVVNTRLKKPIMTWDNFKSVWIDGIDFCDECKLK